MSALASAPRRHRKEGPHDETASLDVTPQRASQTTTNADKPSDQKVEKLLERLKFLESKNKALETENTTLKEKVSQLEAIASNQATDYQKAQGIMAQQLARIQQLSTQGASTSTTGNALQKPQPSDEYEAHIKALQREIIKKDNKIALYKEMEEKYEILLLKEENLEESQSAGFDREQFIKDSLLIDSGLITLDELYAALGIPSTQVPVANQETTYKLPVPNFLFGPEEMNKTSVTDVDSGNAMLAYWDYWKTSPVCPMEAMGIQVEKKATPDDKKAAIEVFVKSVRQEYFKNYNSRRLPNWFIGFMNAAEKACKSKSQLFLVDMINSPSNDLVLNDVAEAFLHHYEKFLKRNNLPAQNPTSDRDKKNIVYQCLIQGDSPYTIGMLIEDCKKDPKMMNLLFANMRIVSAINQYLGTMDNVYS